MALRSAIGTCARLQTCSPPRRSFASRSCTGPGQAPPCPPCAPAPPPPCRAAPAARARATRVVCCPPPQGRAPPCDPPCTAPPLTCKEAVARLGTRKKGVKASCAPPQACGLELDQVARRLELAKQSRRRSYELEAAQRGPCYEPFPAPTPYSLGAERECVPATDGREYATPCATPPAGRCGPGRTPPPPRCVELVRDTECRVRGVGYTDDACAHKPRTLVQIDRSGQGEAERGTTTAAAAGSRDVERASPRPASTFNPTPPVKRPTTKNFTARILENFGRSKNLEVTASCPRRSCKSKCEEGGAQRAGDSSWCANLPAPPAVPPPCRKPTPAELLGRRPPSRCGPNDSRSFHSVALQRFAKVVDGRKSGTESATSPSQANADAENFKKMLQEREELHETGRGRFVSGDGRAKKKSTTPSGGGLDIRVPPGTENVQVRVSLGGGTRNPCEKNISNCPEEKNVSCSRISAAPLEKREPWISIKSLISSCRKSDNVKMSKKDSPSCPSNAPKQPGSPCGSPTFSPRKAPSTSPYKPPATPLRPTGSPCKHLVSPLKPPALPCKPPISPLKPPASTCKPPTAPSPCKPAAAPSPCKKDASPKQKQSACPPTNIPPKKAKFTVAETTILII